MADASRGRRRTSVAGVGLIAPVREANPSKVLLTVHEFFPDFSAGTEVLTLGVARGLRDRGHEVRILTAYPERSPTADDARFDRYEFEGIPVGRFRYDRSPMGGQRSVMELEYNNHLVAGWFRAQIAEFRPDVVHFFHLSRLSGSPIDECMRSRVPTVLTPTDFWFVCPTIRLQLPNGTACDGPDPDSLNCIRHLVSLTQPATIRAAITAVPDVMLRPLMKAAPVADIRALRDRHEFLRLRLRQIDRILAPTRLVERLLLREGVAEDRITICRYGVAAPRRQPQPAKGSGTLVLAFVGTLAPQKGALVAVEAIRLLGPEADVRLDVYGKQGEVPDYQRQLAEAAGGDARIQFLDRFRMNRSRRFSRASMSSLFRQSGAKTPLGALFGAGRRAACDRLRRGRYFGGHRARAQRPALSGRGRSCLG